MPIPNPDAMAFLLNRRSRPVKTLAAPAPNRAALERVLTAGLRVPDHGKLEPWRLKVLERPALARLAALAEDRARARGLEPEMVAKARAQFDESPLCVAVIFTPQPSEKVPAIEQLFSAGAVCTSLVNAALADGWGACWLTGWVAHDTEFAASALGVTGEATIAGFVHIGTETAAPPERPRPDLARVVEWVSA